MRTKYIKQVLNVVDTDRPINVRDTLLINPKIDQNTSDTICELYESRYLQNF